MIIKKVNLTAAAFLLCLFHIVTANNYPLHSDTLDPSQNPPVGLLPSQVPMFVVIGFDDNGWSGLPGSGGTGGMKWVTDLFAEEKNPEGNGNSGTYDGIQCQVSFYYTTEYIDTWGETVALTKKSWNYAMVKGHEVANHTHSHADGSNFTLSQWDEEISLCTEWLTKPFDPNEDVNNPDPTKGMGVDASEIYGFRTPFGKCNDNLFVAIKNNDLIYDCTILEGYQKDHDGTNYNWPYTLHNGSPGHEALKDFLENWKPISNHPGLWEFPSYFAIIPPDDKCEEYGVPSGLREKIKLVYDNLDVSTGKVLGEDYEMFVACEMSKAEFLACMKYSFDLRINNNRCPFLYGTHSDMYATNAVGWEAPNATVEERQESLEEFFTYVLAHEDTRVVHTKQLLDWMRSPVPLDPTGTHTVTQTMENVHITIMQNRITINLPASQLGKKIQTTLFDLHGRPLIHYNSTLMNTNRIAFDIAPEISPGVYLLKIWYNNTPAVQKISFIR